MCNIAVWLPISIEHCYMVVSSCTLLILKAQMESYGMTMMYLVFISEFWSYKLASRNANSSHCHTPLCMQFSTYIRVPRGEKGIMRTWHTLTCLLTGWVISLMEKHGLVMVMKFHCEIRLLYEVFPMSYLMEQAGGQAFTGKQRVYHILFSLLC